MLEINISIKNGFLRQIKSAENYPISKQLKEGFYKIRFEVIEEIEPFLEQVCNYENCKKSFKRTRPNSHNKYCDEICKFKAAKLRKEKRKKEKELEEERHE